ncbi:MAG: hypothetical protein ACRD3T_21355, partial [Terriglobia bacterium]
MDGAVLPASPLTVTAEFRFPETLRLVPSQHRLQSVLMSRLQRLVLCDRFFFVTCRLVHGRSHLGESEFELLAGAIQSRRAAQG